jgi:hypothetical protein
MAGDTHDWPPDGLSLECSELPVTRPELDAVFVERYMAEDWGN